MTIFLPYWIYFILFYCIEYQVTNPVTNESQGTTAHLTDVPDTTVNEITTVSTTFDKNDDRNVSYPVKNNYDTDTNRFTTNGKSRPWQTYALKFKSTEHYLLSILLKNKKKEYCP